LSVLLFCAHATAADLDYKIYGRAAVGTNAEGGKQIDLNNPGSQGNEFRLGNESSAYSEAYFTSRILKGASADDPFFDANLTFAYNPPMNSQYGDGSDNGDTIQVIQAYAKGGNFDDVHMSFWAGKRFYRDIDIHMDD